MNTELAEAKAALSRIAAGTNHAGDIRAVRVAIERLDALSTPPADDVREALTRSLTGGERLTPDEAMQHAYANAVTRAPGRMTWGEALRHFATWMREHDARLVAKVRPRGTVTENTREAEMRELHHFEVEQQLAETIAIVKRAQAAVLRHEHTPASLHMDAILDEVNTEIPSGAEVRPRGAVTDAPRVLADPKGGCACEPFDQDAGGGHIEHLLEYEPDCPVHSTHLYDPRIGQWIMREKFEAARGVRS